MGPLKLHSQLPVITGYIISIRLRPALSRRHLHLSNDFFSNEYGKSEDSPKASKHAVTENLR
jgi:hypothetical protein